MRNVYNVILINFLKEVGPIHYSGFMDTGFAELNIIRGWIYDSTNHYTILSVSIEENKISFIAEKLDSFRKTPKITFIFEKKDENGIWEGKGTGDGEFNGTEDEFQQCKCILTLMPPL